MSNVPAPIPARAPLALIVKPAQGVVRRPWLVFLAVGLVAVELYYLVPPLVDPLYLAIGFGAAAAIVAGWLVNRPVQRGWLLLAAGIGLYSLGDLVYTIIAAETGTEPFPSIADALYLLGQVLFVVGVARLAAPAERGLYRPAMIDAALVALAGVFVAWPTVLDGIGFEQLDPLSAALSLAYPALDLVLIGVLARHLLQPGRKSVSLLLLLGGVAAWLAADLIYAGLSASGEYVSGMWLDAGWLLGYVLVGASALHPSMAQVVAPNELHEATVSNRRLVSLGVVVSIPIVVFVLHGPPVHPIDGPVFALGASALVLLGSVRLLGALHASRVLLAEQRALEAELERRATTDRLTGLANRFAVVDRLTAARERGERIGVVYLDLDDFKRINDAFGHPTGEEILRDVADRLRTVVADPLDVAHVGGDEFAILVRDCADQAQATEVAIRAMAALKPIVRRGEHGFRIQASIGIVWAGPLTVSADEILSRADIAMYQAKDRGGNGYAVFEPAMQERARLRTRLQNDLDGAVDRGEIQPWYQPIFDVRSGRLVGMEALARWQHGERGLVLPDEFIPIAELSGLITGIDRHIATVATAQVAEWSRRLGSPLQLHVNITPQEATDPATVEGMEAALRRSGLPPRSLVVEVTETALIDEAAVAPVLAGLKALGVRLSIDDFGSRYAVLTQLGRLPIDVVKLDRSLLTGLDTQAGIRLFHGIVRLAQSLRLETVAEGVESLDLLPVLRQLGCDAAQGYALGRPMTAEDAGAAVIEVSANSAIA
ncbi:MAG TPA: EAL domain-containing protein [Candidatus Limnocylindrales bacterium]